MTRDAAADLVDRLNAFRRENGLPPLANDRVLRRCARRHARDMAKRDYFSHTTPEGLSPSDRAQRLGYEAWAGENILHGADTADEAFRMWADSPGHRANMLGRGYKAVGVAFFEEDWDRQGDVYDVWVCVFGPVVSPAPDLPEPAVGEV